MKKIIVLTGVSQGLGFSLAKEFCKGGHTVYGCSRSIGRSQTLADSFPDLFFFEKVDISQPLLVSTWATYQLIAKGNSRRLMGKKAHPMECEDGIRIEVEGEE